MKDYVGKPSPLFFAKNMTEDLGGAKIYLKREDLNHTGAHKINNTIGQILLAKRMGAKRIIAETGAGQHGVATATVAAQFGMECVIYMGELDTIKQNLNVFRMELLGAKVVTVKDGDRDLKAAVDAALMDLVANHDTTYYLLGSAVGPYPYPTMVHHFQSIISKELKVQMAEKEARDPDYMIACVGGGSNAIGFFSEYIGNDDVKLIGVEPAGLGIETGEHAAPITDDESNPGVIHGFKCYLMQTADGQPDHCYSIASGLDYPGVGPEHSYLNDAGLADYVAVNDFDALDAFRYLSKVEGIVPAIESAHALAFAMKLAPGQDKETIIVVNLSGRGDKDVGTILASEKLAYELKAKYDKEHE
jgi:tryptophan synthase beta chain